ncbi:sensor histidine kinase [Steroidobacter sp.]|uniref:sensor histidine kinase n=1 Tax=Steroidobacter sp. TaxID=1978227 RepID=UPI0025D3286F|nr:histidine kinase dimerization/phosphoacceptor domain -containing protein [Steroidobacter sp.]
MALRSLLDIAQDLCRAGSAGFSLLAQDRTGAAIVRWEAVSGALSEYEASAAPRDHSPCGLCLDVGIAILISQPQIVFDRLVDKLPVIAELLILPLYDGARRPVGTLWLAHHDSTLHFDSDDVRIVEQLAAQLVLAMKLQERARDHSHALALFQSHQHVQQSLLNYELHEERGLREQAEIENRQALRFKDALIGEINHRTKNTLQVASTLLTMQARASSSTQVREALLDNAARLQILAKVHELLYSNADHKQSVFIPQLLQSLGDALRQSFGRANPGVTLEIACDSIELPTQDAVALALLANETITNAYKHAFPNHSTGTITVRLQRMDTALCLRIADTGTGLAPTNGGEGMGMSLIRTFATQLCGTLEMAGRGVGMGTLLTLAMPAPTSNQLASSP